MSAESKLQKIIDNINLNEDEEQNLQERIIELKKLQNKFIIEVAIRLYAENRDPQGVESEKNAEVYLRNALLNP